MTNQTDTVRPTILPPEMHGVMSISGLRGYGKSFLASQADLPDNILFIDFENKGEGIDSQLNFGGYHAPVQLSAADPLTLYRLVQDIIDEIPNNRYTTVVLDNISPLELALNAEASNRAEFYAQKYGLNLKNIKAGRFGGTKAVANFMIADMCSRIHSKGISLIIATSHMGKRWSTGGIIPNKYSMKGADKWQELSILTLIIIPGTFQKVPSALVQKEQLGTIEINLAPSAEELEQMQRGETGHVIIPRLPPKIARCTFQEIRRYLYNPADFSKLLPHEIPSADELDPFAEKLSKEQIMITMTVANMQLKQEKEDADIMAALEQSAKDEKVNNVAGKIEELFMSKPEMREGSIPAVAKELGMSVPEIAGAMMKVKNNK